MSRSLHETLSDAFEAAKKMEPILAQAKIMTRNGHSGTVYVKTKVSDSLLDALQIWSSGEPIYVNGKRIGLIHYLWLVAKWRVIRKFRKTTPSLHDVVGETIKRRSREIADNVERNNALFAKLKSNGDIGSRSS